MTIDQQVRCLFFFFLTFFLGSDLQAQQPLLKYRLKVTLQMARWDSSLSDDIREKLSDDDGRPLKSVFVDLNEDGFDEKFVPNELLCGNGGCPWLIYDPRTKKVLGSVDGAVLYVGTKKDRGYFPIEAYWKLSAAQATVTTYSFSKGAYRKVKTLNLSGSQINDYFEKKRFP